MVILIILVFFGFDDWAHELVELLLRLDLDEFVLASVLGVGDDGPNQHANARVDHATFDMGEEEQTGHDDFADSQTVYKELPERS